MSNYPQTLCNKCQQFIKNCNFKRHYTVCNGIQYSSRKNNKPSIMNLISHIKPTETTWFCDKCNKSYNSKQKLAYHYWRSHTEEGCMHNPFANKKNYNNQFSSGKITNHSLETKRKISQWNIENPTGVAANPSLRAMAGHSKHYFVQDTFGNDVILQSSWEYLMMLDLNLNGISWRRPMCFWLPIKNKNGRNKSYTPDFWLPDYDVYLDPKAIKNNNQAVNIELWIGYYKKKLLIITNKNLLNWLHVKQHFDL